MSRDLTPRELNDISKRYPEIQESMETATYENGKPLYSKESIDLSHQYKHLGNFGFDFLMICRDIGILNNEDNKNTLQLVEDYFCGIDIKDKKLIDSIEKWYNGQFSPGYYMNQNNQDFAEFIKNYHKL